jgi:hypothetical protein
MKSIYILILFSIFFSCSKSSDSSEAANPSVNIPNAPTSLSSTLNSPTIVNISWSDQSTNELGFKIERKVDGGNYILIATVGPNVTTYQDVSLSLSSSYTYRVYSYNSAGNSSSYSNIVNIPGLRDGLIAYFPFNGNANDESGNGNNGVVSGAILSTDRNGNNNSDYKFNGNGSRIVVNNNTLSLNSNFSISCWIKLDNLNPSQFDAAIVGQYNMITGDTKFLLSYRADGLKRGIAFYANSISNNNISQYYSTDWNPFLSQWYHCVLVYAPGSKVTWYINGQIQYTSNTVPASLYSPSNNQINIGWGSGQHGDLSFIGEIDDLRFYNRILNSSEISYLNSN